VEQQWKSTALESANRFYGKISPVLLHPTDSGNDAGEINSALFHGIVRAFCAALALSEGGEMSATEEILLASTDLEARRKIAHVLKEEGWDVTCASRVKDCRETLANRPVRMIFCDFRLSDGTYRDVLPFVRINHPKVPVVVMSRLADWDEYLDALRRGAFDLIASPSEPTDVLLAVSRALRDDRGKPPAIAAPASEHEPGTSRPLN
jgi:CheY-like chemotaxis protein